EKVQPRMECEERPEIRLATLVEVTQVESERAREHEKDHDEHVGERRQEIALELALRDRGYAAHALAPPVMVRNTSSSRPASRCSSANSHPRAAASSLIARSGSRPGVGSAVSRPTFSSSSIACTSGSAVIKSRASSTLAGSASL